MIPERGVRLLSAEGLLLVVSFVVAAGFGRLFDDSGGWFVPLAATAALTHVAGGVLRRAGVGVVLQLATVGVLTLLLVSWVHAPETLRFGLPTSETMTALALSLDEAAQLYPEARAPAEPVAGFVLAGMVGMALIATMADVAAFRLGAPVQALIPPFALFTFCSILGTGPDRAVAALAFAAAALGFVAVFRAVSEGSTMWLPGDHQRGPVALVRVGGGLTAVALVAAGIAGPMLPGADQEGLWTWRGSDGDGRRIVINPLVDIRSRMVDQSAEVAFVVESEVPSYWRLMALDEFDGQQFTFSTTFRPVGENLTAPSTPAGETVEQRFEIEGLASPYLPAAFSPVRLHLPGEAARWDDRTQTLLLEREEGSFPGMEYRVESVVPAPTPEQLRGAPESVPDAIADRYLDLPPLDPRVVELTESVTAGATTPYDRALALQQFFRTEFDYSLTVPAGHSDSELVRFLFEDRAGYCEQFSAAFAAMARSSGLPSRVAVGFTVGEPDPDRPDRFTVRGEHAHAWPEVWFEGIGWVPFEPTPGRGDPSAESHTGVPPDQEGGIEGATTTTEATEAPDAPAPDFDIDELPDIFGDLDDGGDVGGAVRDDDSGGMPGWLVALGLGVVALAAAVALWSGLVRLAVAGRRRWRRRALTGPGAAIAAVWDDVLDAAASLDLRPRPTETQHEFGERLADAAPHVAARSRSIARASAAARFAPDAVDAEATRSATESGRAAAAGLRSQRSRRQRIVDLLDIRRALPTRPRPVRRRAGVAPA